ncbi:MAG: extracellular solute-binding protein [Candidatus Omnitrophica bacterium]|nr:extracellular solute-binding protein [Candidatus Omnitrophota bacterium]
MKKRIIYITSVALIFFLSGCGKSEVPKEKEIVMWLVGSEQQARSINRIGEEFYKKTGIKVRCEALSWGEAHFKYLTAIAGSITPDIGTMGLTWGTEFGNLGAMTDLKKEFTEDISVIKEATFPGIWNSVTYKDKVYGIPFDLTVHVMYYRTDLIEKPPKDWDELTALLIKLKAEGKGMLFDWGSLNWIGYSMFLWQAGGDYYNADYTKCALDTEEAARGMAFFASLYNKFGVPKTQIPLEQGMRAGDFPIAISGNWKIVGLTIGVPEIKGKWAIATLPKGPQGKGTAFLGGRITGIFKNSSKKNEAWKFIKFLFEPENQIKLYEASWETQDAYLPPNMNTWELLPMDAKYKDVLKAQALDAKGPPPVLAWDSKTHYVNEAIQKVILTKKDAKSMLFDATRRIDAE